MRTKTLALSTMLGLIGTASLVAQTNVYSINAVGYINLTLNPGFNMITCQLQTGTNNVGSIFNNASGIYSGSKVFKWSNTHTNYSEDIASGSASYADGWAANGVMTLNPGEAIWFNNGTGAAITATIVGTVPQGTNTVAIHPGFNMVGSPVPFSGDVVTNMGLTNYQDTDKVFVWNNPAPGHPLGTYTEYIVSLSSGTQGYMNQWGTPDPSANVGQGFWYNAVAPGFNWTQVFSINP